MARLLQAKLTLKWGTLPEFYAVMPEFVRLVEEAQPGWKLIGSWQSITGDTPVVLDMWSMPDADSLISSLEMRIPGLEPLVERLKAIIVREETTMCIESAIHPADGLSM